MSPEQRSGRPRAGAARRAALWAAIASLGLGGVAFAGCGSDDGGETTVEPATTEAGSTGATGPSGSTGNKNRDGSSGYGSSGYGSSGDGSSGGTAAPGDAYDPEQDTEDNDIPPPPGSPQERFEQDCDANPGKCD